MSAIVAGGACFVATVFSVALARRFASRGGPHNLFWAVGLAMFAIASAALAYGLGIGWSAPVFGFYYLFGAVLNVPFLGLGQVYLLWPERVSYPLAVGIIAFSIAAAITVVSTPMTVAPSGKGHIPSGKEVYATSVPPESLPPICSDPAMSTAPECRRYADPLAIWPRIFAVVGNVVGTLLVVFGTVTSALRLIRKRNRGRAGTKIALGNLAIAAGVLVVAAGGTGARFGTTVVLPFTLATGVSIMYAGFLLAASAKADATTRNTGDADREEVGGRGESADHRRSTDNTEVGEVARD